MKGKEESIVDVSTAHHEAGHAVIASLFSIPWLVVAVRGDGSGCLYPDKDELRALVENDPDGNWPYQSYAMVCLAGPVANAKYLERSLDPEAILLAQDELGGSVDIPNARVLAEGSGAHIFSLINDTVEMLDTDKVWLAVRRVADALIEKRVLLAVDVDRLIGKKKEGK